MTTKKIRKILNIIIDTREQQPLEFIKYDYVKTMVDTLVCGDYSLSGHDMPDDDHSIIIERKKNCNELLSNLGQKWDTFKNELEKLQKYKYKMILVCGNNNFQYLYDKGFTKLNPDFALKRLSEIQILYNIPTIFLGERDSVESYIVRLFNRISELNE